MKKYLLVVMDEEPAIISLAWFDSMQEACEYAMERHKGRVAKWRWDLMRGKRGWKYNWIDKIDVDGEAETLSVEIIASHEILEK